MNTMYFDVAGLAKNCYYRVKARGVLLMSDSPWSNVTATTPLSSNASSTLIPKTIDPKSPFGLVNAPIVFAPALSYVPFDKLTWTTVLGASSYVLERSPDPFFAATEVVYEGKETSYSISGLLDRNYYRVKARAAGSQDSLWSQSVSPLSSDSPVRHFLK